MALNFRKFSAAASLLAATAMAAMPAAAAELPRAGAPGVAAAAVPLELGEGELNYDRRWRGYRHRRGPDAGDVIAGVLVLGGIAAIASAANRSARERRETRPVYDPRYDNRRYDDRRYDNRYDDRRGIDGAVDQCVAEVERGRDRVDTVDEASRDGSGWRVSGALSTGEGYSCRIDNDGRLRNLSINEGFAARYDDGERDYYASSDYAGEEADDAYAVGDRGQQWSDDAYARARSGQDSDADIRYEYREAEPVADAPQPAYPGGPLPGEEQDVVEGDGRYDMAEEI